MPKSVIFFQNFSGTKNIQTLKCLNTLVYGQFWRKKCADADGGKMFVGLSKQ